MYSTDWMVLVIKIPPVNAGDIRDAGSIPGLGRSPGGGNGNSLRYFYRANPTDRRAQQATVHGVTRESDRTEKLGLHTHACSVRGNRQAEKRFISVFCSL